MNPDDMRDRDALKKLLDRVGRPIMMSAGAEVSEIHWEGTVPPQKWMNFYTKVLSCFAAHPGFKLRVTSDVPAEGDQGQAKADEARSGLKELGLDDNVELGWHGGTKSRDERNVMQPQADSGDSLGWLSRRRFTGMPRENPGSRL